MNNEDTNTTESAQLAMAPPDSDASSTPQSDSPRPPRRSSGKIASLPLAARNFINQALRDGISYTQIIAQLETQGHLGLNCANLTYWYQTAYQQWLRELEETERLRSQSDAILSSIRELGPDQKTAFNDMSKLLIDAQLAHALQHFDPQRLTELLADKPENFFALASVLSDRSRERHRATEVELKFQKYSDHVAEQKRILDQAATPKSKGGISPEALAQIREAIKLL